jgi:eukaryotic-like serine/threonine-protein kinase
MMDRPMELRAGSHVTPNVRLVRLLGTGGMGSVWVADHLGLATQVAVKFVSKQLLESDTTIVARFNREAALSAQIRSPHVVQIHDHGFTDDGTPFIVMELLDGETLTERIERKGTLTLSDCGQMITQTSKALARAHRLGIVHRDIKPDNLFLVESEFELFVKVLDFGIAKQRKMPSVAPVTATGAMIGTPEFMSPEQVLSAKDVDHRSDLWALGVVAYYALTLRVPFTGETLGSLCVAIAAGKFTAPSALRPGVPKTIDGWFAQAFAVDPKDRFQSAREMAVAYAEALGQAGRSIEDQFSQMGSLRPPPPGPDATGSDAAPHSGPGEDCWWASPDGELAHPTGPPPPKPSEPEAAATVPKQTPTFSGASLATTPRRKVRRAALGVLGAVALAGLGVAGALAFGSGHEPGNVGTRPGEPTAASTAEPTTPLTATAAASAVATTELADGSALPTADAPPTASSSAEAPSASAEDTSSAAPAPKHGRPPTKAVAAGGHAPPESAVSASASAAPSGPPPEPTATSHATSEPTAQPKDRGF